MSRFPKLSETFILREMNQVSRHGLDVALYPLLLEDQPIRHPETEAWLPQVRRLPFLSKAVLEANLRQLAQDPWRLAKLFGMVVGQNWCSPNFLFRAIALFPKAVYAAERIRREGVQHIHAHYASHPALVAWIVFRLTGIGYSITVHAHDIFVRTTMLEIKLRDADFIVAISTYNRDYLAETIGSWLLEKTKVIRCGVMPDRYLPGRTIKSGERLEIIHVGSLQPYKGQRFLVEACAQLKDRGLPFRCRIIGEGEERARLQALIKLKGLDGRIELLGAKTQEEVAALLPTANCYLQPSIMTPAGKMEGIPVALMEAMACQLPVIASDLSGIPELVRDGETGYLIPPADPTAIARALQYLYDHPQEAAGTARAGRLLVESGYDLTANVNDLVTFFEQAIQRADEQPEQPALDSTPLKSTVTAG